MASFARTFCGFTLAIAFVGCEKNFATVSGKVTFKGEPITSGAITFVSDNGQVINTGISPDGNYTARRVPVGPVKISIKSMPAPPLPLMIAPDGTPTANPDVDPKELQKPTRHPLPGRYGQTDTSGLTYDVKPGSQVHDIDLQP